MSQQTNDCEQAAAAMLQRLLKEALPIDRIAAAAVPEVLGRLRSELEPLAGRPLGQILLDPRTSLEALHRIKDHSKRMATQAATPAEEETAKVAYFAAIASALVHHDQKISTHSYASLQTYFTALVERDWIPGEVTALFGQAEAVCRRASRW